MRSKREAKLPRPGIRFSADFGGYSGVEGPSVFGRNGPAPPGKSEVHLFRNGKGVINLNAEIPDGALNLGAAKQ